MAYGSADLSITASAQEINSRDAVTRTFEPDHLAVYCTSTLSADNFQMPQDFRASGPTMPDIVTHTIMSIGNKGSISRSPHRFGKQTYTYRVSPGQSSLEFETSPERVLGNVKLWMRCSSLQETEILKYILHINVLMLTIMSILIIINKS